MNESAEMNETQNVRFFCPLFCSLQTAAAAVKFNESNKLQAADAQRKLRAQATTRRSLATNAKLKAPRPALAYAFTTPVVMLACCTLNLIYSRKHVSALLV